MNIITPKGHKLALVDIGTERWVMHYSYGTFELTTRLRGADYVLNASAISLVGAHGAAVLSYSDEGDPYIEHSARSLLRFYSTDELTPASPVLGDITEYVVPLSRVISEFEGHLKAIARSTGLANVAALYEGAVRARKALQ